MAVNLFPQQVQQRAQARPQVASSLFSTLETPEQRRLRLQQEAMTQRTPAEAAPRQAGFNPLALAAPVTNTTDVYGPNFTRSQIPSNSFRVASSTPSEEERMRADAARQQQAQARQPQAQQQAQQSPLASILNIGGSLAANAVGNSFAGSNGGAASALSGSSIGGQIGGSSGGTGAVGGSALGGLAKGAGGAFALGNSLKELSEIGRNSGDTNEAFLTTGGAIGGALLGGPVGAAIGSAAGDIIADIPGSEWLTPVGPYKAISRMFDSGKSADQQERDDVRGGLRDTGLGENLSFETFGGERQSFAYGSGEGLGVHNLNLEDPLVQETIPLADPIAEAIAAAYSDGDKEKQQRLRENISGMFVNAATGQNLRDTVFVAENVDQAKQNILSIIKEIGLSFDGVVEKLRELKDQGFIDEQRFNVYMNSLGRLRA